MAFFDEITEDEQKTVVDNTFGIKKKTLESNNNFSEIPDLKINKPDSQMLNNFSETKEKTLNNLRVPSENDSINDINKENQGDNVNSEQKQSEQKPVVSKGPSSIFGEKEAKKSELELGSSTNLLKNLNEGENIKTSLDKVVDLIVENKGRIKVNELIAKTGFPKKIILKYVEILKKGNLLSVSYPVNPFSSPSLEIKKDDGELFELNNSEVKGEKKLLEQYVVMSDYLVADVKIWSIPFENTPIYEVVQHRLSLGSRALITNLLEEMVKIIPIKLEDITDPRKVIELKKTFFNTAKEQIKKILVDIDENLLKVLAGTTLHYSYGFGDMEIVMADNWLEEVAVNGSNEPISVYHKRYGWLKTSIRFDSENDIYDFSAQIGRKVGKEINSLNPIMDAHMLSGDRVAATLFPISTGGNTLTIRRFSRNPWTIVHMVDPKNPTMSLEMMAFLWLTIQYELNVLVVGGTASGKTSVLNTLASLIQPTNRVISIEDTREISLPEALHWNWVPLVSRGTNTENLGEVTMLDLMVASLRMRPDRIIVGEIRRKKQAEALFEAMHTGHSVYATLHADTAEQTRRRLTQPPINIPENEIQALHLIVVQYRDRKKGIRRTLEIAELLPGSGEEKIKINYLYRWRPRTDTFEKENESIRVFEDLNLHTGLTIPDIQKDLKEKEKILEWMLKNNIKDVNKVGQIMRIYYKYPQLLLDTILGTKRNDEEKTN